MRILDKFLMFFAGTSFISIIVILSSGDLSYAYNQKKSNLDVKDFAYYSPVDNSNQDVETMVVYSEEVDAIIENYYKNIKNDPGQVEEENRLINQNSNALDTVGVSSGKEILEVKTKKISANSNSAVHYYTHVVKKGESLWRISNEYSVPLYTITSVNPINSRKIIQPGDKLKIPDRPGIEYTIRKGDSIGKLSKRFKLQSEKIKNVNSITSSLIKVGSKLFLPGVKPLQKIKYIIKRRFVWPLKGRLTSGYGRRKHPIHGTKHFHGGIDISAKPGTKIRASAAGVVVFSGYGGSYGKMIILKHKKGYLSVYAHARKLYVKKGTYVKQGKRIAEVGSTGSTTGSHLHFEIKSNKKRVNPVRALNEKIKYKVPVS